jgi:[histone H3]-dimethyl-L-lysine9 demethylase
MIIGGSYLLDVIDVERQETVPMSIGELNEYFKTTPRTKTYNLISFEISKTKLTEEITAPEIVHQLSWVSNGVWPCEQSDKGIQEQSNSNNYIIKPEVQKYCLISARNSYTDFHIDFGGSSVWYHTLKVSRLIYFFLKVRFY